MISHTLTPFLGDNALKFILYCELRVQKVNYVYRTRVNMYHTCNKTKVNVFNMSHKCQRNELKR